MKPKILIVDDRPENVFALEKILRKLDVDLIKAGSGNEALTQTIYHDFTLILLDVQMPDMNGYETAEFLRLKEKTRQIPIIFITAIDRDDKREIKGYEYGAIDFIFKPIDSRILLSKVKVFLELYENQSKLKQLVQELGEDIAERKKLEQEITEHRNNLQKMVEEQTADLKEAKEAAEAANKTKTQFLDMVSHELRTPLTTMMGPLGIIIDELKELDLPDAKPMAELAKKSADRMLLIVEDLLCVTRLEAGRMEFNCEPKSVVNMVRQAVEINAALTGKRDAKFVLGDITDTNIMVDPQRFVQIMTNLLSNAAKYGITEKNKQVIVSAVDRDNMARVLVADKGPGIPKNFQPYVFDKFAMADSSDVREKGGLGLGMLIAKMLVERMGGEIGFESRPGMGTTFWIQFPELNTQKKGNKL